MGRSSKWNEGIKIQTLWEEKGADMYLRSEYREMDTNTQYTRTTSAFPQV